MKKTILLITLTASLFAEMLTLSGSVISDNQKMITSRFMGFVTNVTVSEGDRVKKNQLLYTIDSREIDSAKRQAEAALQMYKNQYENVIINLERHKKLYAQDMVAKYKVEELELAAKNLQDMINIAQARLQEVENQYQYLRIKAPNDGVVISKSIKVGEMAIPGMPAIVLSDLSNLKVEIEIAEQDMKSVYVGKKVSVEIPSLGLQMIGKISAIIPSSNPMTHTFKVKISLLSKNKNIYPGMYATIGIEVK
ncbi:efflux RND transporter periplasmic adaptor subunit [Sulfurimonas sp. C5]|uniref:efflux RND transporter periplasmic adaptor subunit n=1 Tax=Sulfurimonas sp. C5 TaxID=3036947 RepID=UPI0024553743|nr:efflux RND transporter periplasmic adaptor subunit [Sulfurimonas sp. C5]MDH4943712.1 efflux RND transporter periplasmic adaptor subunit [Sulfurimonas sp. C5]